MKLDKTQIILIAAALVVFVGIYYGLDTKPKSQKEIEKSRSLTMESTGIQNIVMDAKKSFKPEQVSVIEALQGEYESDTVMSTKVAKAETLASQWYEYGIPAVSGYYAEEIAKMKKDSADAWTIAGTTYAICLKSSNDEKIRSFCRKRGIEALEKAISLDASDVNSQINLALIYVEQPDKNPMQGIQMLLSLNEKYPDNVAVMNQLIRLGLQTNQIEKALTRVEKALGIEPDNKTTICLAAEVYQRAGNAEQAAYYTKLCEK